MLFVVLTCNAIAWKVSTHFMKVSHGNLIAILIWTATHISKMSHIRHDSLYLFNHLLLLSLPVRGKHCLTLSVGNCIYIYIGCGSLFNSILDRRLECLWNLSIGTTIIYPSYKNVLRKVWTYQAVDRRTDNTIAKRKKVQKTIIYKTLFRKLKIEQLKNLGVNSGAKGG